MVNKKQIKQWLKDGTISQAQAKKMLADSSQSQHKEKSNKFSSGCNNWSSFNFHRLCMVNC